MKLTDHMTEDEYPDLADWPTAPKTIEAIREMATMHTARMIDGVLVDAFTAQVIVRVYDAITPEHQAQLMTFPIDRIGHLCWKAVTR